MKTGWTLPLAEDYFRWFNTTATAYRGGDTFAGSIRRVAPPATLSDDGESWRLSSPSRHSRNRRRNCYTAQHQVDTWALDEPLVPVVNVACRAGEGKTASKLYGAVACGGGSPPGFASET